MWGRSPFCSMGSTENHAGIVAPKIWRPALKKLSLSAATDSKAVNSRDMTEAFQIKSRHECRLH